jgi:hypothetical protein
MAGPKQNHKQDDRLQKETSRSTAQSGLFDSTLAITAHPAYNYASAMHAGAKFTVLALLRKSKVKS